MESIITKYVSTAAKTKTWPKCIQNGLTQDKPKQHLHHQQKSVNSQASSDDEMKNHLLREVRAETSLKKERQQISSLLKVKQVRAVGKRLGQPIRNVPSTPPTRGTQNQEKQIRCSPPKNLVFRYQKQGFWWF